MKRYLTVPLNRQGKADYDMGLQGSGNTAEYVLEEEEFHRARQKGGLLGTLERVLGEPIREGRSVIVPASVLRQCSEELEAFGGVFAEAARNALLHETFLGIDL